MEGPRPSNQSSFQKYNFGNSVKNYAKADTKVFWSSQTLLNCFTTYFDHGYKSRTFKRKNGT